MGKLTSWVARNRIATAAIVLSLLITQGIAFAIFESKKKNDFMLVEQEVLRLKSQLEESLNHSVTATKMLAYLIRNDLLGSHFERVAKELLEQNAFIDAIQYVQENTIISTYPLEGHEPTIGYAVLEDTTHRREAMLALERGDLYFEGPFNLLQGGRGIVGRYPIIIDDEYWGFSAVVIRYETILEAIGTDSTGTNETYTYQIAKINNNENPIVFFEDREIDLSGVHYSALVPFGNWMLSAQLNTPAYVREGFLFSVLGLLLTTVLGLFFWYLSDQPRRLQLLVDEKTNDLNLSTQKLEDYSKQLLYSNKELEQFAYVTSHDLQEPLRMVTSFLSLLEKKYGHVLDEKGKQYIHYAADGAHRMRQIILDLLEYSRIGNIEEEVSLVDMKAVLDDVLILNRKLIKEKKAVITAEELPQIYAEKSPMHQMFQNLIQNAITYQRENSAPEINIRAEETVTHWIFYIKDNGIGIPSEYREKIFNLFERLHGNGEYSGTGIGLAICKKIAEQHKGIIGVDSEQDRGSTFYFTVLKKVESNQAVEHEIV